MAQALLTALGGEHFVAYSAGIEPASELHPLTLEAIHNAGLRVDGLHPKNIDVFRAADAPQMDFVITVGDELSDHSLAALGWPTTSYWPIPDPVPAKGSHAERAAVFAGIFKMVRRPIELLVELPEAGLDRLSMQRHVNGIGDRTKA